ncbi:uncharacterized protein VTP21DRAFT_5647 [Calcarisporiella thermophila]|uniref:uncharacterized protein n=1 Tax=Calcarisporiella thermophila TaxID=911321 RepID=UPI003743482D
MHVTFDSDIQEANAFGENDQAEYDLEDLRSVMTNSLSYQLRLNTLTELHRLLSAQFVIEGKSADNRKFDFTLPIFGGNAPQTRRCTYFKVWYIPKPIEDKTFQLATKAFNINRTLADYLFHIYVSDCFIHVMHPKRASFLESYYRDELEPALVHTAIAFSALHLLMTHPQTYVKRDLHLAMGSLLAQARRSLEEVFDNPSSEIVLAFLNMEGCMRWLARFEDAYNFYSLAALMALTLRMDKDDTNKKDLVQVEFQRRIWTCVCKRELHYRFGFNKPILISLESIYNSPKPTVGEGDSELYKFMLLRFMTEIVFSYKILRLTDIDWTLPDVKVAQQLVDIVEFLQREQNDFVQFCGKDVLLKHCPAGVDCVFWTYWCAVWRQFIKSDAPPGRLETDLMKQLKAKAIDEYAKGLVNCIKSLKYAVRTQRWCKDYPFTTAQLICESCKCICPSLPDTTRRRKLFMELLQILEELRSLQTKGIIEKWLAQQIAEALEQMKSAVFSREVLESVNKPVTKSAKRKKK